MVNIRRATESHLKFWASVDERYNEKTVKKRILQGLAYLISEDEVPVGVISYAMLWDDLPFLSLIKILPKYRGRGIGREAIYAFERELKEEGFRALLTSTQTDEQAQFFYRAMGYEECGCLIGDKLPEKQPMEMFFIKKF